MLRPFPHPVACCCVLLGVVASVCMLLNVWLLLNFAQQLPTTRNNMPQAVEKDATCNMQQCWEFLANNVVSGSMGHKTAISLWHRLYSTIRPLNDWGLDDWGDHNLMGSLSPGGTQQSSIRGGSTPGSNHLPLYIPFWGAEKEPLSHPFIDKWYPFHVVSLELCIPFNCCKYTFF